MICDPALGLYDRTDGAAGCWSHTVIHVPDDWQTLGLFVAVIVLVALGALVVSQLRGR